MVVANLASLGTRACGRCHAVLASVARVAVALCVLAHTMMATVTRAFALLGAISLIEARITVAETVVAVPVEGAVVGALQIQRAVHTVVAWVAFAS